MNYNCDEIWFPFQFKFELHMHFQLLVGSLLPHIWWDRDHDLTVPVACQRWGWLSQTVHWGQTVGGLRGKTALSAHLWEHDRWTDICSQARCSSVTCSRHLALPDFCSSDKLLSRALALSDTWPVGNLILCCLLFRQIISKIINWLNNYKQRVQEILATWYF